MDRIIWIGKPLSDEKEQKGLAIKVLPSTKKDYSSNRLLSEINIDIALRLLNANLNAERVVQSSQQNVQLDLQNIPVSNRINLNKLCGLCTNCTSISNCRTRINRLMNDFLQDTFHVREYDVGQFQLNISTVDDYLVEALELLTQYTEKVCEPAISERDALSATSGGNIFVMDEIVFVGADEIQNYTIAKHRSLLGLDANFKRSELEEKIIHNVFASYDTIYKLVWVGTPLSPKRRHERGDSPIERKLQPCYHIDLFFNPIGSFPNDPLRQFHYLFASIDKSDCRRDTICEKLSDWLDSTQLEMANSLRSLGYLPTPIRLPLEVIVGSGEIQNYSIIA